MYSHIWQKYPFLRLLIPLVVGIVCGDAFPHALPWRFFGVVAVALTVSLYVCHRYSLQQVYGVWAFVLLGLVGYQGAACAWEATYYDLSSPKACYKVRICDWPEEKKRSILCPVHVQGVFVDDTLQTDVRQPMFLLYFHKDSLSARLMRGDELLVQTHLTQPRNWGDFDYARFLRRKGVSGTGYVPAGRWRVLGNDSARTLRQIALDYREQVVGLYHRLGFQGDNLAVLAALTVGDQSDLSEEIVKTYSVAGASHVLSLSGLHIGFLYALLWWMLRPFWARWRWLKPFLLLFLVAALWGFAFFTGLASPVVRSVIMASFVALTSFCSSKLLTINSLAATAFLMLLVRPLWLFDVSFQLSFLSLAAILVFQPPLYACWTPQSRILRYVWGLITVSVAAQIGCAPLVMLYFSQFPTHFLLSNLLVVPLSSLILYAAVVLLALTPLPGWQTGFVPVVESLLNWQNGGLKLIENLPFSSLDQLEVSVVDVWLFYLFLALLWFCLHRFTFRRVCAALLALLACVV